MPAAERVRWRNAGIEQTAGESQIADGILENIISWLKKAACQSLSHRYIRGKNLKYQSLTATRQLYGVLRPDEIVKVPCSDVARGRVWG